MVEYLKENEKILFELSGSKMQGKYALIKTKFGGRRKVRMQVETVCSSTNNDA